MNIQQTISLPTRYISTIDVLGPKDIYLNKIKSHFSVKIKINESDILIYGDEAQVQNAVKVFEEIIETLSTGEKILPDDVDLFIHQAENGHSVIRSNDLILQIGKTQVRAKTAHQKEYVDAIENNTITFAIGCAGTAKSFLAITSAVKALKEKRVSKIILSRPPIALQGYDIGFIPGTDSMKMAPWIAPLTDVLCEFYSREKIEEMIEHETICTIPLAYIRGRSFKNSFIILDEAQNASVEAFKSVMTRLGVGSKLVICGDTLQTDINGKSGLEKAAHIMEGADNVAIVRMGYEDIVRSGITAEVIKRFTEAGY